MSRLTALAHRLMKPGKPNNQLPIKRWKISKDDEVMIINGKDQGETGRVRELLKDTNQVIVAGRNTVWKTNSLAPSGRVQKEMPIHVSSIALLHPQTREPVKVAFRQVEDPATGKITSQRVVQGTHIPLPRPERVDERAKYTDSTLDTSPEVAAKVTFTPDLSKYPMPKSVVDELRNKYGVQRIWKERAREVSL